MLYWNPAGKPPKTQGPPGLKSGRRFKILAVRTLLEHPQGGGVGWGKVTTETPEGGSRGPPNWKIFLLCFVAVWKKRVLTFVWQLLFQKKAQKAKNRHF